MFHWCFPNHVVFPLLTLLKHEFTPLHQLPRAAITKYHKLSGLKTTEMYFLTVQESRSLKSRRQQDGFLLETLGENRPAASVPAPGACRQSSLL